MDSDSNMEPPERNNNIGVLEYKEHRKNKKKKREKREKEKEKKSHHYYHHHGSSVAATAEVVTTSLVTTTTANTATSFPHNLKIRFLLSGQKTELSPPTHQYTESTIPNVNVSPKHLPSTRNQSNSSASTLQTTVESSIISSTTPSSSSALYNKPAKDRDERLRSSSPFTSTVSSVGGTSVTAASATVNSALSLFVSVPLSTANVPGLNLPTTTTADHPTPSQSTRAATQQQQQSAVTERQSPRIHHQVTSSPAVSEHGCFSSLLPSPANSAVLHSRKSPSPSITSGSLTATTTESGNLKISYEKQNSRVAQLQEQESAPVRRSRSRSGEHNNLIQTKPRFGKKRSAAASNTQFTNSSSSEQQLQQQRPNPPVPRTSHTPDIFSEASKKSQSPSPVPSLPALPPPTPVLSPPKISESDKIGNNISNNINKNNNNNNINNGAINLSSSDPSTSTPTPPLFPSTPTSTAIPSSLTTPSFSASASNFTTSSSSSPQTTAASVKSKNNISDIVNSTMALANSCRNSCSPITPSPPAPSIPAPITTATLVVSNISASKTLNKKLLRAQQSHFLQQQQLGVIQQQQQNSNVAITVEVPGSTAPPSSLPIDDSISNTNPPPPTLSRTPDSGILSSSFNISGSSQSSQSGATPTVNGGLKFSYEEQPGVPSTVTPTTIDTNLNNNAAFKDSPPSSPGSVAGSAKKRGRKSNEMKDVKVFQNGGCAVSEPVNTPIPAPTSNGPIQATHMLGNQLNPTSNVAQKLTDQLHMEMQDHSVYSETQSLQFVGVPFPSKPVNNIRNSTSIPSTANSLASMFGGNAGGYAPQSLEQLLERQWEQGSQFLMEQAQHFDIASLLSCLHQLQTENVRLEEHVNSLIARRDHLLAVNARLAIPLNANIPQSQVNLNNIHLNGPSQPDVAASPAAPAVPPSASALSTSSTNVLTAVPNPTSSGRAPRLSASVSLQLPTLENGIDFRHSSHQQSTSVPAPVTATAPALVQSNCLRHSSSVHPNCSTTTPTSSTSHHSNHQHHTHQHHHQQQQQPALAQHSSMSSSTSNVNAVMTSASVSRQTQLQASSPSQHHPPQPQNLPQPQHPHQQTHHPQHHSHHAHQQHQQQQQQHSLHQLHQHTQNQSHSLMQQHSHNHHHPSSTGPTAPHHIQQQPTSHHQMPMSSNDGLLRTTGGGGNSGTGRVGNNSSGSVGATQMLTGRPGHGDSTYHPAYSHQSQLRRDETQGKAS